jgi:hypothetical protein
LAAAGVWTIALGLQAGGCSTILGLETTTLAADAGVADTGPPAPGADWTCVGDVPTETPTVTSIAITVNILDFATGLAPTADLNVKACASKTDNVCATPIATATSDATGTAVITLPLSGGRGFSGYLEVTGTNYIRYLWYFSRPLTASRAFPLNVLTVDTLDGPSGLLAQFGVVPPDDTRGHLAVNTTDCQDVDAAGVQISTDDEDSLSKPFYYSDGLLSPKATQTDKGYALGGFFNLVAGTVTVTATPIAIGKPMGQDTLIIAPHTLTTIRMLPN